MSTADLLREPSLQARARVWVQECFGAEVAGDRLERNHRFLEEALELVQACGCTASEAHQLVDYTFGRPAGERGQEVGGVMITLAALCLAQGLDMHAEGETELARICQPDVLAKIRAKQASKPKHSPLPQAPTCEQCGGTGEIFGHAEDCADDLCDLNGDEHSCGGRMEPCTCTQAQAPDIPPGCEMARGWCVEVSAQGRSVLVLSDVGYSGLADLEPWESTIRGCAEHLQGFIGPAHDGVPFDPDAPLETGEGDALEPRSPAP